MSSTSSTMSVFTVYGASDDLVEVTGDVREEYDLNPVGTRLRITAPGGDCLDVMADFGCNDGTALDSEASPGGWVLAVITHGPLPDGWEVVFGARENDPETEDPALTVRAPAGSRIEQVR